MIKFFTLLEREIKSFFYSPVGYFVIAFILFLTGFDYWWSLKILSAGPQQISVVQMYFSSIFFWMTYVLIFPLITMRVFSEEFSMGTIETLMTAPVRDWQVVMAKWAGCLFFYVILWVPTSVYFWVFGWATHDNAAHTPGSYLGCYLLLLLMGMFYCSVGCLGSVLTKNQIVAAVISLVMILGLLFMSMLQYVVQDVTGTMRDVFGFFSPIEQMQTFSSGIIDSRPIVWYLTMTVLMLSLTYHVFQLRKWKS